MNCCFTSFIVDHKPVYEGVDYNKKRVKIFLDDWYGDSKAGKGSFTYGEKANATPWFYLKWSDQSIKIRFCEGKYSKADLKLKVSEDFKSLEIIDRITKQKFGTLYLRSQSQQVGD